APASGSAFDTGTTTVTATATDGAGNTATCTLNVTVNDTEDPAITCPADITVDNDPGLCSAVVNIPAPTVLDNCPGATFEYTPASGSAFEVGTTNVTATTADGAGNTASCTVNVTVNDDEAPNMVCKKSTVDIELGQTLLPEQVDSVSTDNCAITQLSVTPNLFGCGSLGLNTVTLTAQDAAGHSNTCTTTVNVIDNNPPTAVCNNPTVNLTSDGVTTVAAAFFDGGSAAVCPDGPVPGGGLDFSASMTAFDCDNLGETYTVTLTVTSQSSGLSGQCTSTVFVDDPNSYCCPPPMAVCENITVQLDASGNANITPTDIGSNSTAECGLQSEMLSNNSFGCTDAGPNTVTYTITDVNGDSDGCTVEVTVEDNISPSAVCLNTTVELQSDGTYILQESDVYDPTNSSDNCPYGPVPGAVESVSFPAATYTCDEAGKSFSVTVTVEDPSGNTDDCTAIVSVEAGTALPGSWTANDIGDPGEGSDYAYDPCTANNPDQGDFTISTGGYNLIPQTSDNLAFTAVPLCGNGGIQAHIKSVSGGYAGLMIRESSAPGAKMVAVYSNLTNLLRRETRIITNGARSNSTLFAAFPKWLRLIRQGNYIRAFYRNSSSGSWTLFHQAYVPMDECVEMGLAVFTTDPSGEAFAVFGNVNYQSQGGNNLSVPSGDYKIPAETKRSAVVFPNPALEQFTLSFSKPLTAPGTATLLNELGQRVRQFDLYSGDLEIDAHLSGLPPGLYFLRAATSDGYQETLKLLKQ
ncbi:HYR domain-containing protein, partial [Phaeodactylibacter sp.]|uniref:HYR domain-containing protein n=1 Tax=Phaeodactylibacter sp. TaxID=1940289 RepID=UPI0025DFF47F